MRDEERGDVVSDVDTVTNERWLIDIAWRLDSLRWVPTGVLGDIAVRDGACMAAYAAGDPPGWLGHEQPDRALAARLCAGCPVQDQCLELELRTAGEDTVGVWGALSEVDRRALLGYWRQRGDRADDRGVGR
ncbi:WhiB family transcriptional regulator [Actinokineospora sp.]|uniref:WhiB family transcriptional regulator n=1 Tax=Actinokineospora sp. TaxID=1872133 RepID=UPI0040381352